MGAPPGEIRFDDGAAYDRYMGVWSRAVGATFLDWLAAPRGQRWLDVGCGSGAFTETVLDRCAPSFIAGIDPSEAQLAQARARVASRGVELEQGDAMALPFPADSFDVAVMPLVIFFVPKPAIGVAEMARVVRPGGIVAAYAWAMDHDGFPYAAVQSELRAIGANVPTAPSQDASRIDRMRELWSGAGLGDIETRAIGVQRTFADWDDYWATIIGGPSVGAQLRALSPAQRERFTTALRERLPAADEQGRITVQAVANAVKGRVASSTTRIR